MSDLPALILRAATVEEILPVRGAGLRPGEPLDTVRVENDAEGAHWALATPEGEIVSVASLFTLGHRVQLRKFATLPAFQNRGIGTRLLAAVMDEARKSGATEFWCNARIDALAIYSRAGLEPVGERYLREGRLYQRMSRPL